MIDSNNPTKFNQSELSCSRREVPQFKIPKIRNPNQLQNFLILNNDSRPLLLFPCLLLHQIFENLGQWSFVFQTRFENGFSMLSLPRACLLPLSNISIRHISTSQPVYINTEGPQGWPIYNKQVYPPIEPGEPTRPAVSFSH